MPSKYKSFLKESLILLVLILVVSVAVNLYKTWNIEKGPAPHFEETTITGMPVNLAKTDKPVLVHFWASWCPICSLEHGSIQSISEDYNVISIAMDSGDENQLQQFMREKQMNYPVIADEDGRVARNWSVTGVPSSFIVAPDGEIKFIEVGYTTELGLRARLWWSGLN